jgi:membrane associated rhomboid family serine protease
MNRFRSSFGLASATQYLIVATVLVYALQLLSYREFMRYDPQAIWNCLIYGAFKVPGRGFASCISDFVGTFGLLAPAQLPDALWQLVTYIFLHGPIWHIGFNMYALWLFGQVLERVWGARRFLIYYFFTGIGAGITTIIVSLFTQEPSLSIGASGAIYGVLLAFAVLFPNTPLYLFFIPVPIRAKYAVIGLGVLAFYFSATGTLPGIANIAHLGGLLFGLIALKGPRWLRRFLS